MAQDNTTTFASGQVPCSYHPNEMTGLRCSRCGKPICPKCAVRTPVGLRCPDCAGVRGLPTYRTPADSLLKAAGAGLAMAVETIARFSGNKRGADLQLLAIAIVTIGLLLSRVLLAQRFGISFADVNALDAQLINAEIAQEFGFRGASVSEILQLQIVPDVVYALMAYLIAWVR